MNLFRQFCHRLARTDGHPARHIVDEMCEPAWLISDPDLTLPGYACRVGPVTDEGLLSGTGF